MERRVLAMFEVALTVMHEVSNRNRQIKRHFLRATSTITTGHGCTENVPGKNMLRGSKTVMVPKTRRAYLELKVALTGKLVEKI